MTPAGSFTTAARCFVTVVGNLSPQDYERPGLGEWDVRALVGHTSRALLTVENYLRPGSGPVEVDGPVEYFVAVLGDPADQARRAQQDASVAERGRQAGMDLGADPARGVADLAGRVIALVERTPPEAQVASPAGTMTLEGYLPTRTLELTVHTLDICKAVAATPPADLDGPMADALELTGRLAGRRVQRADLLLAMWGRGSTISVG